ncbi:adenylyltransferase/cytidyltransferase family protein [Akkermansiaceae bacterium]|nr:adenylyltransferase/cytidyltransferase family protein [Akkermansiaceae bacterium]
MVIGYTTGAFDLFHIGHLNILRQAKSLCDRLIVGVTTDEYIKNYKSKMPSISYAERAEIVRSIKFVDSVIPQNNHDKFEAWEKLKFDLMFVGDDWYNTEKWLEIESEFRKVDVKIIYFPRTPIISSTKIKFDLGENSFS